MGGTYIAAIECAELPRDKDREIRSLIKSMNLDTLPSKFEGRSDARDIFYYTLTIMEEASIHTVQLDDVADVPPNLRALLTEVMRLGA